MKIKISFIILSLIGICTIKPKAALNLNTPSVLVNKEFRLMSNYIPKELVKIDLPSVNDKYLCYEAYQAYIELYNDAIKQDHHFIVYSAYRSYQYQEEIYKDSPYISKPGSSEHQTGLALDITIHGIGLHEALGDYPAGIWLKKKAHLYGFIIRYPKYKESITGYPYEPWHIRYVGKEIANTIFEKKITLEEYILK